MVAVGMVPPCDQSGYGTLMIVQGHEIPRVVSHYFR